MAYARASGWACIARFGGIGDNLIASSPLAALKRKGLKTEVITSEPQWMIFEHNPHLDKLSVKSKKEIPLEFKAWQQWFAGRADEYDTFAHLSHSCENQLALFPAQTSFWWPAEVRRKLCNRNYLEFVHDICGVPYEFGPLFFASTEERAKAQDTKEAIGKGPVIAWSISGTRLDKMHPYLPGMIARVIKELDADVVMMGGPEADIARAKIIEDHVIRTNGTSKRLHSAISVSVDANNWPIRRSLAFAQAADLVVTVDTGLAWAVAFEQVPKIIILSHASPENITKHWINTTTLTADPARVPCWPCHRLHDDQSTCVPNRENNGAACITDISVETIVSTVRSQLGVRNG